MHFQLRTPCAKINFPLTNPGAMWHSPEFDPKKKVVILATGWTTTVNGSDTIEVFSKAYNCRGDVNFVVSGSGSPRLSICRSVDLRIGDKALPRLLLAASSPESNLGTANPNLTLPNPSNN